MEAGNKTPFTRHGWQMRERAEIIELLKQYGELERAKEKTDFDSSEGWESRLHKANSDIASAAYWLVRKLANYGVFDIDEWHYKSMKEANAEPPKIEEQTYKGELEGFPKEVVEKMLERQFKQTGKRDVSVFENKRISDRLRNGFHWDNTIEGFDFWTIVIESKNFDHFFERYPKTKVSEVQP